MFVSLIIQGASVLAIVFVLKNLTEMIIPLFIAGFGGSVFWSVSTTMSVDVAGDEFRNMASGTLFTVRNGALIVGIALLPVFISLFTPSGAASSLLIFGTKVSIYSAVRNYVIFLALLSLVASALIGIMHNKWDRAESKSDQAGEGLAEGQQA